MDIVLTAHDAFLAAAANEWRAAFPGAQTRLLAEGVGVAAVAGDFHKASTTARSRPLLFTRHIFPVQIKLPAGGDPLDALDEIAAALDLARSYSVQARAIGGKMFTRNLSEALQAKGHTLDIRTPAQAVSVFSAADAVYIGVSDTSDNLSDWNGGMMHFSSQGLISRAECKLLEALVVFGVRVRQGMNALDLGAAPGGWSNALAARGARVVAVDPADLDARVAALPAVQHVPATAQTFLEQDDTRYDLIVNDMKMDAHRALDLLLTCRERLSPGGLILSTLKLPKHDAARVAHTCVKRIRDGAELLGARQLFHNRTEITVCFW